MSGPSTTSTPISRRSSVSPPIAREVRRRIPEPHHERDHRRRDQRADREVDGRRLPAGEAMREAHAGAMMPREPAASTAEMQNPRQACGRRRCPRARGPIRRPSSSRACRARCRGTGCGSACGRPAARSTAWPGAGPVQNCGRRRGRRQSGKSSNVRFTSASQRTRFRLLVVARELRGAGHAQAVAEAREHDLVREVGERHGGRAAMAVDRDRRRIALGRIDEARHAERPQQERAVAAERHHVGVGVHDLLAVLLVDAAHAGQRVALARRATRPARCQRKRTPRAAAMRASSCGEALRVARFVAGREDAARELVAARRRARARSPRTRRRSSRRGRSRTRASAPRPARRARTPPRSV